MKLAALVLTLSLAGCLSGCITPPPVVTDKAPCSARVPEQLKGPVPNAQLAPEPEGADEPRGTEAYIAYVERNADRWRLFSIGQTAAKRQEFEEKTIIIEGQVRCEDLDREAIERSRPRVLGIF